MTSPQDEVREKCTTNEKSGSSKKGEAANATASPSSAECSTGPGIVCLESESYDAAPPNGMIAGDFLIHKPGIG